MEANLKLLKLLIKKSFASLLTKFLKVKYFMYQKKILFKNER